jgi:hypothetical protein
MGHITNIYYEIIVTKILHTGLENKMKIRIRKKKCAVPNDSDMHRQTDGETSKS